MPKKIKPTTPSLADDDIMPTESRESCTAGGRIEAATLLECGLGEAIVVGCKDLQQEMLSRRSFSCLCPDAPKIGITLLIKLRVGHHGVHVCASKGWRW